MNKIKLFGSEKPRAAAGKARWLVLACLLMPMTMSGQEMIRAFDNHTTDFSLVRLRTPLENWIVYNQSGDTSFFGKINTSGTTFDIMLTEQQIFVKDMVMAGDTLYFCGQKYNSTTNQYDAIMGYFKTMSMPSTNVYYVQIDSLSVLRKIDYYKSYTTKHVVMVGTARNGDDVIVDSYHDFQMHSNFHFWSTNWARISGVRARFDDIAVCGSNVVVSANVTDSSKSYLFFIEKPPLINVPFYLSYIHMKKLTDGNRNLILLQRGNQDTLYAVNIYGSRLYIYQFVGMILEKCISTQLPYSSSAHVPFYYNSLLDVQTDRDKKNLNILVENDPRVIAKTYQLFHQPMGAMNNTTIGCSHIYNHTMFSLGTSINNYTLATGKLGTDKLGIFRITSVPYSDGCVLYYDQTKSNIITFDFDSFLKNANRSINGQIATIMPTTTISTTITTECQQ